MESAELGLPAPIQAEGYEASADSTLSLQVTPTPALLDETVKQPCNLKDADNKHQEGGISGQAVVTENNTAERAISKSKQRKLAKQERLAATKTERRAREKAAKKEKLAEKRRLVEEEGADPHEIGLAKKKKPRKGDKFNANVVIDLGFDDKMSEKVSLMLDRCLDTLLSSHK